MAIVYNKKTGERYEVSTYAAAAMVSSNPELYKQVTAEWEAQFEPGKNMVGFGEAQEFDVSSTRTQQAPTAPSYQPVYYGGDQPYVAADLTRQEMQQVGAIQRMIKSNQKRWVTEDEMGYFSMPRMGMSWIEDMGEQGERYSDKVIGEVQNWYGGWVDSLNADNAAAYGDDWGLGSGFGGGGAAAGPVYLAPDRDVVFETVKGLLYSRVGSFDEQRVDKLVDVYLDAHKKQWDVRTGGAGGEDIDPTMTVINEIKGQDDYKRIHALRPKGTDDTRWIADRSTRLQSLGLSEAEADERAVWAAQSGTALKDLDIGMSQMSKGRKDVDLFNKIQSNATRLARMI